MRKPIKTLQDAISYQLRGLIGAEIKVAAEFKHCEDRIHSVKVRSALSQYVKTANDRLLKLNRVFSYLMQEPRMRQNEIIDSMIEETHRLSETSATPQLKDILFVACIQNINAYKVAGYKTAYLFAVEMDLDTPADLLLEIIQWETSAVATRSDLAISSFNELNAHRTS